MRRFLTSSPVPGPRRQSHTQEERTISRSSLSDASIISFFKFYKLLSSQKGSKLNNKMLHKGMASCCKCPQKIRFDSESRGNLKKHFKTKHPSMLSSLDEAMSLNRFKPTNRVEKTIRQITPREATERPTKLSQEMAQQAYVVWFAEGLKPLCDTEDEATRTFLNFLKPEFKMPCRKTLTKRLNKYAVQSLLSSLISLAGQG